MLISHLETYFVFFIYLALILLIFVFDDQQIDPMPPVREANRGGSKNRGEPTVRGAENGESLSKMANLPKDETLISHEFNQRSPWYRKGGGWVHGKSEL